MCHEIHFRLPKGAFLALFLVAVLNVKSISHADELAESQAELERINSELTSLQKSLAEKQREANEQRRALRQVESEMGTIQTNLSRLGSRIQRQQEALVGLAEQKRVLNRLLSEKADDIEAILRLAYKQNNQPLIKLVLSGERPEDLARHMYYMSKLTANQQQQLETWITEQNELAKTIDDEEQTLKSLAEDEASLRAQQQALVTQKNRRAVVVSRLEQDAANTAEGIALKEREREQMAELITELEAKLESLSLDYLGSTDILNVKGRLPWPVEGRLTNGFGRSIDGSALTWQGWLISASSGTPVKAVHGGRIVFADFFKSNGLLIIVDHGNGIWSLYGRNQSLLTDVGSWVEAGDVIAEVGQSGGYNQSGLYFEVRTKGEPENPANWLEKR